MSPDEIEDYKLKEKEKEAIIERNAKNKKK